MTPVEWTPGVLAAWLGWGTLAGLDLVSAPQVLLSRPLVAGTMAGLLAGDAAGGAATGALLELFALDVMPVGSSRYPDYGPPTVAAVAVTVGLPVGATIGAAGVLGLLLAAAGGWSMVRLRTLNAAAIRAAEAGLAAAEPAVPARLQWGGLLRDAGRAFLLTAVGLAAAAVLRSVLPAAAPLGERLTLVLLGTGLGAALHGAVRAADTPTRMRGLAAGLGIGGLLAGLLR